MTTANSVIRKKHLNALKPSRFVQAINEVDSYSRKIRELLDFGVFNPRTTSDDTILSMRVLMLQSNYCFTLLDFLIQLVEGIRKQGLKFLLVNLYDLNSMKDYRHTLGYFSDDWIFVSYDSEEVQQVINASCYRKSEAEVLCQIKDVVRRHPILDCCYNDVCEVYVVAKLLSSDSIYSMMESLSDACTTMLIHVEKMLGNFTDNDVATCYKYWNNINENRWKGSCRHDFRTWKHGLFAKHKEKNIRAKYYDCLTKLYESGFLDFIIDKMDIRYQKGSFLSVDGHNYEERNGFFYPEDGLPYGSGLPDELLFAEHAVGELLFDEGTPNPNSVGIYLMVHISELGENEIKSFFEFTYFKKQLELLAKKEGILHIGLLSSMSETSAYGSYSAAQSSSVNQSSSANQPSPGNQPSSGSKSSCTGGRASKTSCWHPENQIHLNLCRKLREKGYCQVDGDHYQWTATIEEFGYLIYYSTEILKIGKHPSSDRILWDMFCPFFGIDDKKKKQAQNAITCLKRDLEAKKHNANCEKAENIKKLIMMVKA